MSKILIFIRSVVFSVAFSFTTLLYGLITPIQFFFSDVTNYGITRSWSVINLWLLRVICGIDYQVVGAENIPKDKAFVLVSNHQSTWETVAFMVIFPRLAFVCKRELLKIPLYGWGLSHLKPIAIDRAESRAALTQVRQQGGERLASGVSVMIFPEGTRVNPGEQVPHKPGGAMLATAGDYAVLPVVHNSGEHWSRQSFLKQPGTVVVSIGELVDSSGMKAKALNQQLEAWMIAEQARLPDLL